MYRDVMFQPRQAELVSFQNEVWDPTPSGEAAENP